MLNKDAIIKMLESHSMKAKVFGAMTTLIPDTEFTELAHEILLLVQPNSDTPPQLNKHDVSGWQEFENMWISEFDEVLVKNKRRGHYLIWKTDELDFSDVHLKEYCWMPLPA